MILGHPWMLLLFPLPWLIRYLLPAYRQERVAIRVPLLSEIADAAGQAPSDGVVIHRQPMSQTIGLIIAWVCLVLALARPQVVDPPISEVTPTRDLLLAIDLSGSMETVDFTNSEGQPVDRLAAVKEVLDQFLAEREGDRVGMIVFGSGAFVQVPFTQDLQVCRRLLSETDARMAGPRTALGDAIGLAITVFQRSDQQDKVLIALTDGNDTGSRVPPSEAARIAADEGIIIHTVGVGDPKAAGEESLDEVTLREVAKTTGGEYSFAANRQQLERIYGRLDDLSQREIQRVSFRPKRDVFHWLIAAALALSTVGVAVSLSDWRPLR